MRPARQIATSAIALILLAALSACSTGASSPSASAAPSAGGGTLTITGVEYAYQGVPASAKAGTVITFTNAGHELHELITVRRNEDVTTPVEELIALPEEEANKLVTIFPVVPIAAPGESAPETVTLDQPGGYIFICFVPVGTTSLPDDPGASGAAPDGPPHFTRGMFAELTVTE